MSVDPSSVIGAPDPVPVVPPRLRTTLPFAVPSKWNVFASWRPEIPASRIFFGSLSAGVAGPPQAAVMIARTAIRAGSARVAATRAGRDMRPPG